LLSRVVDEDDTGLKSLYIDVDMSLVLFNSLSQLLVNFEVFDFT